MHTEITCDKEDFNLEDIKKGLSKAIHPNLYQLIQMLTANQFNHL